VEAVRPEHPLAALLPCDNVFAIESRWYRDNPLVIRGPGPVAMSLPAQFSRISTVWRSCCSP
jgi:aspartokinase/homoserine dehydrogenase 2